MNESCCNQKQSKERKHGAPHDEQKLSNPSIPYLSLNYFVMSLSVQEELLNLCQFTNLQGYCLYREQKLLAAGANIVEERPEWLKWKIVYCVNNLSQTYRNCFKERSDTHSVTEEWEIADIRDGPENSQEKYLNGI